MEARQSMVQLPLSRFDVYEDGDFETILSSVEGGLASNHQGGRLDVDAIRRSRATSEERPRAETRGTPLRGEETPVIKTSNKSDGDEHVVTRKRTREADEADLAPSKKTKGKVRDLVVRRTLTPLVIDLTLSPDPARPAHVSGLKTLRTSRSVTRSTLEPETNRYRKSLTHSRRDAGKHARQRARLPKARASRTFEELESKIQAWFEDLDRRMMEKMDNFERNILQCMRGHSSSESKTTSPVNDSRAFSTNEDGTSSCSGYRNQNNIFSRNASDAGSTSSFSNNNFIDNDKIRYLNNLINADGWNGGFDGNNSDIDSIRNYDHDFDDDDRTQGFVESDYDCEDGQYDNAIVNESIEEPLKVNAAVHESIGEGFQIDAAAYESIEAALKAHFESANSSGL